LRLPQSGGPGSCLYFPHEQGSLVIPPGIELLTFKVKVHTTTDHILKCGLELRNMDIFKIIIRYTDTLLKHHQKTVSF
jgi:hypothetical protein